VVHCFHALRNRHAVEGGGQAQHAFEDVQVFRIIEHIAHETAVDLEQIDRETLEVGQ